MRPHRPPRAQDLQSGEPTQFWELRNRKVQAHRTPDESKGKCSYWMIDIFTNPNTSPVPPGFLNSYRSRVTSLAASARPNPEAAFSRIYQCTPHLIRGPKLGVQLVPRCRQPDPWTRRVPVGVFGLQISRMSPRAPPPGGRGGGRQGLPNGSRRGRSTALRSVGIPLSVASSSNAALTSSTRVVSTWTWGEISRWKAPAR